MRLGLVGDVHAEDELLRLTLAALRDARVDRILCTGDLVDGQGDIDRACALLREARVLVVRGNHDRWIRADELRSVPHAHRMTQLAVETISLLKELPTTLTVDAPGGGKVLLCHGVGENDMLGLLPDTRGHAIAGNEDMLAILLDATIRVMVAGHTHKPMLRRLERGRGQPPLFAVNPGTLARQDEPGYAILDLHDEARTGRIDFYRFGANGSIAHTSSAVL